MILIKIKCPQSCKQLDLKTGEREYYIGYASKTKLPVDDRIMQTK